MRSYLVVVCSLLVALCTLDTAIAATCDPICATKELWGISSAANNFQQCKCSQTTGAKRTGADCNCDVCYKKEGNRVFGYSKVAGGGCPLQATDCGDCDIAAGSGSTSGTKTPTPTTSTKAPVPTTPPPTSLTPSASSSPPSGVSSQNSSAAGNSGAPTTVATPTPTPTPEAKSGDGSLATWQYALIICSCVLVLAVGMLTITSCYCKARNSMKENIQNEEEAQEYANYWHPGSGDEHSGGPQMNGTYVTQGGGATFASTASRPNSNKNSPYNPTYDERIMGRVSLGGVSDTPYGQPQHNRPVHVPIEL